MALSSAEAELAGLVLAASEGMGVLSLARRMLGHRLERGYKVELGETEKSFYPGRRQSGRDCNVTEKGYQ